MNKGEREARIADDDRAARPARHADRPARQTVQHAANLDVDDVAPLADAFDEELRRSGLLRRQLVHVIGGAGQTIWSGREDRLDVLATGGRPGDTKGVVVL